MVGPHKKTKLHRLLNYNQEIIKAWTELSQNPSADYGSDLKKVSLWNNRDITDTKGLPLFFPNLSKAGITTVGDLFDKENNIINNLTKHNINPNLFLAWMTVCKALPKTWIQSIKETNRTEELKKEGNDCKTDVGIFTTDEYIPIDKLTQKNSRKILNKRKKITESKFKAEMSEQFKMTENDWKILYQKINTWSISTKHRSFSWRLYNGVIFTNKDYARFGFKESAKCSFCDELTQTREHLLLECLSIRKFRQDICAKFNILQKQNITNRLMLFGCLDSDSTNNAESEACDTIIMLKNKYIYYSNYHETKLSIEGFSNELKLMERIEYAIAEKKGKLGVHLPKWERIGSNLGYSILRT
jgi:zinc-binding in reverse transcriptase